MLHLQRQTCTVAYLCINRLLDFQRPTPEEYCQFPGAGKILNFYLNRFYLPLMHNFSLDKHSCCGRVDCRCTWLARNATPRFRFKMTKIGDFARAVARATKVESRPTFVKPRGR